MLPGDFVITPSWTWHDHGNIGEAPMVWVDGLDMHIVNLMNASFREESEEVAHRITRPDDSSMVEFGYAMAPADQRPRGGVTPILNYPYARTREALASLEKRRTPDAHLGHIIKYLNPMTGDWAIPTIATQMRVLPAGFETLGYRSTDATVFVVVEGQGSSEVGDAEFDWEPGDIVVAPSWCVQRHRARTRSVLFSYSDRAVQEKLGIWREDRAA
jgi:gentisate 1,2-dioxygenase